MIKILSIFVSYLFEAIGLYFLFESVLFNSLLFHIGAAFLFSLGIYNPEKKSISFSSFVIGLFFPFLGLLGLGPFLAYLKCRKPKLVDSDDEEVISFDKKDEELLPASEAVAPSFDLIMSDLPLAVKQDIVESLIRQRSKEAAFVLHNALRLAEPDTKFLLLSAKQKLEEEIDKEITALEREKNINPSFDTYFKLAQSFKEYSSIGLLEKAVEVYFFDQSLKSVRDALNIKPLDFEAKLFLGRLLVEKGEILEAKKILEELTRENANDYRPYTSLAEAYFREKDYHQVKACFHRIRSKEDLPFTLKEMIEAWT